MQILYKEVTTMTKYHEILRLTTLAHVKRHCRLYLAIWAYLL